jgi:hypothetical protein
MPGKARVDSSEALHHIIVLGIGRVRIYKDDADRNDFPERIGAAGKGTKPGRGTRSWGCESRSFRGRRELSLAGVRRKSVGQAW